MTPSQHANDVANAISDGMSCLHQLRAQRAAPPLATSEDLVAWQRTSARCRTALEMVRKGEVDGRRLSASWRPTDGALAAIDDFQAQLAIIAPDTPLPTTLFDAADVALVELGKDAAAERRS